MRVARVRIRNFRCFGGTEETWGLDWLPNKDLNLLIGPNGCGKTSLVEAMDLVLNWEGRTNRALITEYDFSFCNTSKTMAIEITLTEIGSAAGEFRDAVQFIDRLTKEPIDETEQIPQEEKHERAVIIRFEAERDEEDGEIHPRWVFPKFRPTEYEDEEELSRKQHQAIAYFRIRPLVTGGAFTLGEYSALGRHLRKMNYQLGKLPDKLKPTQKPPECRLDDLQCDQCTEESCKNRVQDGEVRMQPETLGRMLAGIASKAQAMLGESAWAGMGSSLGPRYGDLRSSLAAITLGLRTSEVQGDEFIPFERLSAGERYAMSFALATRRLPGSSAPIIVMEEPETALYPSAIGQIITELQGAGSPQVFVTSHSESVVRRFSLEDIFLLDRQRAVIPLVRAIPVDGDRMGIESLIMPGRTSALLAENVIVAEGLEDTVVSRDLDRLASKVLGAGQGFAAKKWCFFDAGGANHAKARAGSLKELGKKVAILLDGDKDGREAAKDTLADFPTFIYSSSVEKEPTLEVALLCGLAEEKRRRAVELFQNDPGCRNCAPAKPDVRECMEQHKCASGVEKRERKRRLCSCCLRVYAEAGQFPPAFGMLLSRLDKAKCGTAIYLDIEGKKPLAEGT